MLVSPLSVNAFRTGKVFVADNLVLQLKDTTFLLSLAQHQQSEAEPLLDRLYEQLWRLMLQNWSASPESFAALPSLLERLATFNSTDKKGLNLLTWRVLAHEAKIASIPTEVQSHLRAQVDTLEKSAFDSEGEQSQIYMKLAYCNVAQVVKEWMNLEQASSKHNEYANLAKAAISSLLQQNPHYTQEQQGKTAYMALELASMNISPPLLNFETFVVSFWLLSQRLDMTGKLIMLLSRLPVS